MGEWIISSSVLIVLCLALRYFFRRKLAMRAWYALWLVVAVRLLVPVSFAESSLSILNFFDFAQTVDRQETEAAPQEGQAGKENIAAGWPESLKGAEPQPSDADGEKYETDAGILSEPVSVKGQESELQMLPMASKGQDSVEPSGEEQWTPNPARIWFPDLEQWKADRDKGFLAIWRTAFAGHSVFWYVWLSGVILSAACVLILNGRYRKRVRRSRKQFGEKPEGGLPVYVSAVVDSPCMFGLAHPAVYLSREAAGEPDALRYVLCHENIHYRHHDNLWVVVRAACLCLHWYNPLVWIAAALSEQDGELACDERTLEILGQEERIRYGRALLDFSAQGSVWQRGWKFSTAMSSGKKLLKERLQVIVGEPKRHRGIFALVMLLTAFCAAITFTGRVDGKGLEPDADSEDFGDAVPADAEKAEGENSSDAAAESTGIASVDLGDGREYTLKISGEAVLGSGVYRIDRIDLNWVHDRMENTLQTIRPEDVRVLYTRSLEDIRNGNGQMYFYTPQGEPLYAKPLCTTEDLPTREVGKFLADENKEMYSYAPEGGLVVADLNFDGYQDFCVQGGTGTVNIPYYCYLWNPAEGQFEPGYMIPNVEVDEEAQLIRSATDDGNGLSSVKYYRFDESNLLHMVRYVEENQSLDAVFPTLDLTYCEPVYALPAVDEWDYGTRYGGALIERFVYWAKRALTELYEWSGTKIQKASFTVTIFGDVIFANTPADLAASRTYYDREYGARAGFEECIEQMFLSTERVVWFSPVIQWNVPENLDQMTNPELVEWYFQRSALTEGETLESVEERKTDDYIIRAESGNYYQIYLNAAREVSAFYGPYGSYPEP